tara:strand:+ start:43 stop:333 length:291 start_codon:yes stop_codon:yes gene_type:complete
MEEKIFPSLKNVILVGFLIWIGVILMDINEKLSPQSRFIKTQLMCANYISKLDDGKLTPAAIEQGRKIAKFADFEATEESIAVYCIKLENYSGSGR